MHRRHHPPFPAVSILRSSLRHALSLVFAVLVFGSTASGVYAGETVNSLKLDELVNHPALQPFHLEGKKLPPDLYLVRTRGELPNRDGIVVHGAHRGIFLVSGAPDIVMGLSRSGCAVMKLEELPSAAPPRTRDWVRLDSPDPDVAAIVAQVEWTGVLDKIEWLVGFGTRFSYAPNHHEVAQALADLLSSYGLQVTMQPFSFGGPTMWNVEATQVGTLYPNSYVVICGHFDSISEDPMVSAPGADDNATGATAVLTAAEIISQHSFEYSIRYLCFSAEEQGLVGSYFYTAEVRRQNLDVVGALNFDMLGYWEPGVEQDLEIETNHASLWLAEAVINAADLYTDAAYELHIDDWAWWGDHFRFWMQGYPGVNHEESWDWYDPDFNPYYHSTSDLPQYVGSDFTVNNIKVAVAALATLANPGPAVPVTFDVKPGSCPNPFNPKGQGVVPAVILGSAAFDVNDLDVSTLRIEGVVSPVTIKLVDIGTEGENGCPCDENEDGILDMLLKFSAQDIAAAIGPAEKGDVFTLQLTGRLFDGTVITGEDAVVVVGNAGSSALAGRSLETPLVDTRTSAGDSRIPEKFALHQNVPNPFNPTTGIRFDVPAGGGLVTLRIYDVSGRLVRTLVNGVHVAGQKSVTWDGRNDAGSPVATGTYLYRLTGPGFEQTRKMLLLK